MIARPVLALLPSILLLAACANAPTQPPGDGGIEHPTGGGDLLVRVSLEGGFVPVEWNHTNVPTFSLYGDGTIVVPGAQIAIYPAPALPAISRRTVDEAGIQRILEETLAALEGVPDDLGDMGSVGIADAATTVITVRAGGVDRTVEAYALAEIPERPPGMPADVFRARERLAGLVGRLGDLAAWLPEGSLGPESPFTGSAARVFVGGYRRAEDLPQEALAWPLDAPLTSFGEPTEAGMYRCGTVSAGAWDALRRAAADANQLTPWTDAGDRFGLLFRPLLPDESGC